MTVWIQAATTVSSVTVAAAPEDHRGRRAQRSRRVARPRGNRSDYRRPAHVEAEESENIRLQILAVVAAAGVVVAMSRLLPNWWGISRFGIPIRMNRATAFAIRSPTVRWSAVTTSTVKLSGSTMTVSA